MFDVDKLYTYMYATKEILRYKQKSRINELIESINTIQEYYGEDFDEKETYLNISKVKDGDSSSVIQFKKEIESILKDSNSWKIVKDKKKSLENDLLDIHIAVFENANEEFYQGVMSPNGFGDLKRADGSGLAKEISEMIDNATTERTNYLSPQYQQSKFLDGVAGKSGVSAFSVSSMFCAMSQDLNLRYIETRTDKNDKFHDDFKVSFGDITSIGELSNYQTITKNKNKSKVIEAFQSASVDNANEQILSKLNINDKTFSVISALAHMGFEEDIICYFINQPIVYKYVEKAIGKDSVLEDFSESDIFDEVIKEYSKGYTIDLEKLIRNKDYQNVGIQTLNSKAIGLKDMIKMDESRRRNQSYVEQQISVLMKFKKLNSIGESVNQLMQTVNAESKGLGKSYANSFERGKRIAIIDSVTNDFKDEISGVGILNGERLLYEVDDLGNYVLDELNTPITNSLSGFTAEYAVDLNNAIGEQFFPYNKKEFQQIFNYLQNELGVKINTINQKEKFVLSAFAEIKSYLFANSRLFGKDFDAQKERERLFFGEKTEHKDKNGLKLEKVKSLPLANIISALQKTSSLKNNAFIKSLSVDVTRKSSDFNLVKYISSSAENLDESQIHQAFISLFINDKSVSYNVKNNPYTISSRDLALDLIKYAYLTGGKQEAIHFTRYIPIEVLKQIGFTDNINNAVENISENNIFGNVIDSDFNVVQHSNVIEQMIQHKPFLVKNKITGEMVVSDKNEKQGVIPISTQMINGVNVVSKFKSTVEKNRETDTEGFKIAGKYVTGKIKGNTLLYKKYNGAYYLIPTLGTFGMSEYNFELEPGKLAKSIVPSKQIDTTEVENLSVTEDSPIIIDNSDKKPINQFQSLNQGNANIINILQELSEIGSEQSKNTSKELLKNDNMLDFISKIKVEKAESNSKGSFDTKNNILKLSSKDGVIKDKNDAEVTILHEIVHAYTGHTTKLIYLQEYRDLHPGEYERLPQEVIDAAKRIDTIRRSFLYKAKQNTKFNKELAKLKKYKDTPINQRQAPEGFGMFAYALESNEEFMAHVFEDAFVNQLKELTKNDTDGNIFKRLWDALIKFLGLNNLSEIDKTFLTNEVFQYIKTINKSLDANAIKEFKPIAANEKLKIVEELLEEINNPSNKNSAENIVGDQFNNDIYSQLGNKTQSKNVVIKSWGELKDTKKAIIKDNDYKWSRYSDNSYEVSSQGDKRFSALIAKLKDGRTIEEAYQLDVKGYRKQGNNWSLGKGKPPIRNITKEQQWNEYKELWKTYLSENPNLLKDLQQKAKDKVLTDKFASTDISQARALTEILNEQGNSYIITTRIQGTNEHFGNPYSHEPEGKSKGLIKTETIKEAVEKYTDWVIDSQDERANWIREQLKSGKLKGKPIIYYKELGEPSHATALDYLINKYNWNIVDNPKESSTFVDNAFDFSPGVQIPLTETTRHLYEEYHLLNKNGEIKTLPNNKKTEKFIDSLNKTYKYTFKLRKTPVGPKIIIFKKENEFTTALFKKLTEKYGQDAIGKFDKLTKEEQEIIIKCL